jgi:hypothetical protein
MIMTNFTEKAKYFYCLSFAIDNSEFVIIFGDYLNKD